MAANACTFTVFRTVEEFESILESYKKQTFVEFHRRESRTISAARKREVDRPLKAELKYYDLLFVWWSSIQTQRKGKQMFFITLSTKCHLLTLIII